MKKLKRTTQIIVFVLLASQASSALSWQWSDLFRCEFWTPRRAILAGLGLAGVIGLMRLYDHFERKRSEEALFKEFTPDFVINDYRIFYKGLWSLRVEVNQSVMMFSKCSDGVRVFGIPTEIEGFFGLDNALNILKKLEVSSQSLERYHGLRPVLGSQKAMPSREYTAKTFEELKEQFVS